MKSILNEWVNLKPWRKLLTSSYLLIELHPTVHSHYLGAMITRQNVNPSCQWDLRVIQTVGETEVDLHFSIIRNFSGLFQHPSKMPNIVDCNNKYFCGQCLWLSWQSGRFRYQRTTVRIQSSAKICFYIEHLFYVNCVLKRRK